MEKTLKLNTGGVLVQDLGTLAAGEEGCILEFHLTLEAVVPETRTALAVSLSELDEDGREYPRGVRTLLIPAHHGETPQDIAVGEIRFLLPQELCVGTGERRFLVRYERQCIDCPAVCHLPPQ